MEICSCETNSSLVLPKVMRRFNRMAVCGLVLLTGGADADLFTCPAHLCNCLTATSLDVGLLAQGVLYALYKNTGVALASLGQWIDCQPTD